MKFRVRWVHSILNNLNVEFSGFAFELEIKRSLAG